MPPKIIQFSPLQRDIQNPSQFANAMHQDQMIFQIQRTKNEFNFKLYTYS